MRSCTLLTLSFGLLLLTAELTRADDDAKAILDKAIKAHGGADKLAKLKDKAAQTKTTGTVEVMGLSLKFTEESFIQPGRLKSVTDLEISGQTIQVVTVCNGEKAWVKAADKTTALDGKALDELKELTYLTHLSRFTPLKDKPYELSSLGELKVNDRPAVGVKVASKGHRDIDLWFDKETGLLAKVERRGVNPMTEEEFTEERIITEYQEKDGIKVAKKAVVNRDGKKFLELEVQETKYRDKFDDSEFAKP